MNFEDLQKTWQIQPVGATVTIDRDGLLREVRRNHHKFQTIIFWRDVREVGIAFVLTVYFGWIAWVRLDWTWGLVALICFGEGLYMWGDHWWQRRGRPAANAPLKDYLAGALREVNHQIWLLRDALIWTYLLPLDVGVIIAAMAPTMRSTHSFREVYAAAFAVGLTALTSWGVYWLNQYAVRKELLPRRQELEAHLASLD